MRVSFFNFLSVPMCMAISLLLTSCEDPIDVTLDKGTSQLVVDAMVLVHDGPQKVRLTMTNAYFDQSKAVGVSGAKVALTSTLGRAMSFTEDPATPGDYRLDSLSGQTGEIFTLRIEYQGEVFEARSELKRGSKIDTLYQEERKAQFGNDPGTYLYLSARDPEGVEDFYWLRKSVNGLLDRRTATLTLCADGAFSIGDADGLDFIFPIRESVNLEKPFIKPDTIRNSDGSLKSITPGDTILTELISIDKENWRFMTEMQTQLNNAGLFADPISNVRGNVLNTNSNSKVKAVGSFGVGRISRAGIRIR